MTLDEFKPEVAALSAPDRVAFADWILHAEDLKKFKRGAVVRDLEAGLDQAEQPDTDRSSSP